MKYSITFLTLAVAALLTTWTTDHVAARAAGTCTSLAFGLVAMAYAFAGPKLLLKRPDGRRPPWAWVLYWPYFLLNGLSLTLFRGVERHPPFAEVAPNLFLGRRLMTRECRGGATPRWPAVLDLAAEFSESAPLRRVRAYRSLPVLDATAPTLPELSDAVAWLVERVAEGPVYVHCALGHGRSATVVLAYLLATGRAATVPEGLSFVQSRRPGVSLGKPQLEALNRYSQSISHTRP